jgi:hypothetical protein
MHRNAFDIIFIAGISCCDVFLLQRDEKIVITWKGFTVATMT